jgi:hydroxymethylbilane synthase
VSVVPARLRLGTRGSPLALWQSRHVAALLEAAHPGLQVELIVIKTEGDASQKADVPLTQGDGKGIFVREIEDAMLERRIDLAVHSLKDLPTEQPAGLVVTATLERADPRDGLLAPGAPALEQLPVGTVVATGSPRRRAQILHVRPDLRMTLVRGNVDTRVRKLKEGQFGAMVLAMAGVTRLGIDAMPIRPIPFEISLPAPGQGAIAIETREDDAGTRSAMVPLDHPATFAAVRAERGFLAGLGGGCLAPAAAHGRIEGGRMLLDGMVGDPDGRRRLRDRVEGDPDAPEALGRELAKRILARGGDAILKDARTALQG